MKRKLTTADTWFINNLKALIGAQEALVKTGKQHYINRASLAKWIIEHLNLETTGENKMFYNDEGNVRCDDCGCNVFQPLVNNEKHIKCNSCGTIYQIE